MAYHDTPFMKHVKVRNPTKSNMICKSLFAAAAIRSCSGAFVTNSPRPLSTSSGGVRLALRSIRHQNYSSKPNGALPILHRGVSSLGATASSSPVVPTSTSHLQPLVVCGPSGVGKGTIIARFMEARNEGLPKFGFSVSHTTRQPRPGEIDGVHYHFVTREFMLDKVESGSFFIEHAEVHGNLYGTSFQSIFDVSNVSSDDSEIKDVSGMDQQCLLDIDVEGVRSIKEFQSRQLKEMQNEPILGKERSTQQYVSDKSSSIPILDAKFIFIAPPSADVLKERLAGRGTETPETLERRFQNAKAELEYGMEPGNFDATVVNDDLDQACEEFEKIVEEMYRV